MKWIVVTKSPNLKTRKLWEEFLAFAELPTHYTTPNFFVDPYIGSGDRFAVLAMEGDTVAGVITGVDEGRKIVSGLAVRPQSAFKVGADRDAVAVALFEGIVAQS